MAIFDPAQVKQAAQADPAFRLSLRFISGNVRYRIGDDSFLLAIRNGELVDFGPDDGSQPAGVTLSGPVAGWEQLLVPEITPPGCQSPLYNDGRSLVQYDGDTVEAVGVFARVIGEMHRIMREVVGGRKLDNLLPEVERDFDAAVGRYTYLKLDGVQYRIYFEEAGEGKIPLILQHTAGADSRQMRHILEDPDFRKNFRIIAYDVPFHGRSLPPTSQRWWEDRFMLTKSLLMQLIFGLCDRLELDRPVFMGSAMGGMLALDIAHDFPGRFRAVVALNAGPPMIFPPEVSEKMETFSHPQLSNHWPVAMMTANMAGTSPGAYRRELGFVYSQVAPGVAMGALNYYMNDHTLTPEQAGTIDRDATAVYMFTGKDDSMGGEAYGTGMMVDAMPGVPFTSLQRLGHFGPAENPEAFKQDLWPTFAEIIRNS